MAIKIAITGAGLRGRDWIKEVNTASDFELVACVDTDPATLEATARQFQVSRESCYSNLEESIKSIECDAVIVVTPADQHFKDCYTALSHDKAVLVEKPFTTTLRAAHQLVNLAEAKQLPLIVAQNYRYLRSYRTVRQLLKEGRLGRVGIVVCQYYRIPHEMSLAQKTTTQSVLWGIGVHHLDALRYVLDDVVTNVMSDDFTLSWTNLPRGASIRTMLSFDKGTRCFYTATYESRGHEFFENGQEFYARFVGELATLHVFQRWLILCEKGKLPRLLRRGSRKITEEQTLLNQLKQAMRGNDHPETSGRDNLQTMALLEACLISSAKQTWTNPQELLDELD
jgi:predicted dehydrogenase